MITEEIKQSQHGDSHLSPDISPELTFPEISSSATSKVSKIESEKRVSTSTESGKVLIVYCPPYLMTSYQLKNVLAHLESI